MVAYVVSGMNLSIPISAKTCHNELPAALLPRSSSKRARGKHDPGMTQPDNNNVSATDLSQAEMMRLLVIVGRERKVEAFEMLFRHYSPRIRSFMTVKTKDRQVAEELMQETMVAVWNKAAQFDPARGNVSAWIFTIARNIRIDAYRRKRPVFEIDDPAFVPDSTPSADQEFEQAQDAGLLRQAMAALPAEQFDVLKRAFFDDVSHSTIAQELGLPLGTVKSRIRLAFEKLRSALEGRR
jgi:RNA polymerase sigma-70 factor (ECF subfamily)